MIFWDNALINSSLQLPSKMEFLTFEQINILQDSRCCLNGRDRLICTKNCKKRFHALDLLVGAPPCARYSHHAKTLINKNATAILRFSEGGVLDFVAILDIFRHKHPILCMFRLPSIVLS